MYYNDTKGNQTCVLPHHDFPYFLREQKLHSVEQVGADL